MTNLYERRNVDGTRLSQGDVQTLRDTATDYAAAVSAYTDLDQEVAVKARPYAEHPWEVASTGLQDEAFSLMERRERAILDLVKAKKKFGEAYNRIMGHTP